MPRGHELIRLHLYESKSGKEFPTEAKFIEALREIIAEASKVSPVEIDVIGVYLIYLDYTNSFNLEKKVSKK